METPENTTNVKASPDRDISLLNLLHAIHEAITGDDGEPVGVLSDPLCEDRDGGLEVRGGRYDLRPIVSHETLDAFGRYIHALQVQAGMR